MNIPYRSALLTLLAGVLVACSDSSVVVLGAPSGDGIVLPSGDTGGGTGGDPGSSSRLDPADVAAARFLQQATFGPSEESLAEFRSHDSTADWIDAQMALPASLTQPYTEAHSNGSHRDARHEIWWSNAVSAPDQLRQRVAFALSQIFVVSDLDYALGNAQYGMANYYDMLIRHAFGNYRELLEDVTLHPVMGVYLSMVRNEKADTARNIRPDENYAREVMQLFSIGLYELDANGVPVPAGRPNPTYTQATIEEYARVFTGWNYDNGRDWTSNALPLGTYQSPMIPVDAYHDFGSKTLLGGRVAPAGLGVREDLAFALDSLFEHPNVGPFIGRQLIQRLVTSNPSPAYVGRVAAVFDDNGNGERGDLGAVVRAILLDEEARSGHLGNPDFGKLREPVVRYAHFWRALHGTPGPLAEGVHAAPSSPVPSIDSLFGQAVMKSPSVFNFYLPDHALATGTSLQSPEMQIMSEANLAATHNNYHHQMYRFHNRADLSDDNPRVTIVDLEPLAAIAADNAALLDWYDLYLYAGQMPGAVRSELDRYLRLMPTHDAGRFARVQDTLFLVMASPSQHLQR